MAVSRKQIWLAFFIVAFFLNVGTTVTAKTFTDSLDILIKKEMKKKKIPGLQLAIVQHGKIIRMGGYGIASIENKVRVTNNTVFPINSMTKAFTGVAVMQLVEAGKLDLDAPVSRYLDSLPVAWRQVTIKQMMTHISGIPDIVTGDLSLISSESDQAAYEKALTLPLDFKPGEKLSYNQMNYAMIGRIIDKLSGVHFTTFIEEKQFHTVGMRVTSYHDSRDVIPGMGRTYTYLVYENGEYHVADHITTRYEIIPDIIRTCAGIYTTAQDLAHWIIAIQQGRLLKKASLPLLWTPGRLNDGQTAGFSDLLNGYAIGWPVVIRKEHPAVAPVGGERSAMFYYPGDDLAVIVFTNLMGGSPQSFIDQIASFYFSKGK